MVAESLNGPGEVHVQLLGLVGPLTLVPEPGSSLRSWDCPWRSC